jgi:hypothetical protein
MRLVAWDQIIAALILRCTFSVYPRSSIDYLAGWLSFSATWLALEQPVDDVPLFGNRAARATGIGVNRRSARVTNEATVRLQPYCNDLRPSLPACIGKGMRHAGEGGDRGARLSSIQKDH